MPSNLPVAQIKLQRHFGGGEVFTRFLCQAIATLGRRNLLFVHPAAEFWTKPALASTELVGVSDVAQVLPRVPSGAPLIVHGDLPLTLLDQLASRHAVIRIVHMPANYVDPRQFASYARILGVSAYVVDTLRQAGAAPHPEPFYGMADPQRLAGARGGAIPRTSEYEWDRRKFRDRFLGVLDPLRDRVRSPASFSRRAGFTLGIVSRLTPIKQFPQMFTILAPILAEIPDTHLDIFGAGGYASVRDLRRALAPLGERVHFWGAQDCVAAIYPQLDYLLTGLPEREALGLNVIEAQACGTPVLAVAAPPFTETVIDGVSGYLFRDPRQDSGADFRRLLHALRAGQPRPDPRNAPEHLDRFSPATFRRRVADLLGFLDERAAPA